VIAARGLSSRGLRVSASFAVALAIAVGRGDESAAAEPHVLKVGPTRFLVTVADAAREAVNGDIVEIDAGDYIDDVATWPQDDIVIRAAGGRVRLESHGRSAQGKAIFVITGHNVTIEGIEFSGMRVPSRNGAGIRHEGGKLTVRDCLFERNEMGLLTSNHSASELVVERSEFRGNGIEQPYHPGDDVGHQIYVGRIARFTLRDSYVHAGMLGHLVKSRARQSFVLYNRLTDETGRASYELEFPDGGEAYAIGNVIEQSETTDNEAIVSFGAEHYVWPLNELHLVNNTLVDRLPSGGEFVRVRAGAGVRLDAVNNLLLGSGRFAGPLGPARGNFRIRASDVVDAGGLDVRLLASARVVGRAVDPGTSNGMVLRPDREYVHPRRSEVVGSAVYSPGAFQSLGAPLRGAARP
jgi:hypothetical protein